MQVMTQIHVHILRIHVKYCFIFKVIEYRYIYMDDNEFIFNLAFIRRMIINATVEKIIYAEKQQSLFCHTLVSKALFHPWNGI